MGFVRFLVFAVVLVILLVLVVVPLAAGPVVAQMLRQMGLNGDDVGVTVEPFDLSLFSGRSEATRVTAENVVIEPAVVDELDLTFGGVSFVDGTFESVRGSLSGVAIDAQGLQLTVSLVSVDGPAGAANVTGQLSTRETERFVLAAAGRVGLRVDDVRFAERGLLMTAGGLTMPARLAVEGGALVLEPELGPIVFLFQPAPGDPWRLTEAWTTPSGLSVRGVVDAERLAENLPGTP